MSRRAIAVLATASAFAVAGCGDDDSSSSSASGGGDGVQQLAAGDVIGMKSLRFKPEKVQVAVGQKVTWRNDEVVPHNVVANSGADFKSEVFGKDKTYSFTPKSAGTIKYECTLHPGMVGELDVVAR